MQAALMKAFRTLEEEQKKQHETDAADIMSQNTTMLLQRSSNTSQPISIGRVRSISFADDLAETDSADAAEVIQQRPLHLSEPIRESSSVFRQRRQETTTMSTTPRLTLSAFRRPENSVRLTKCDRNRRLEDEYELHSNRRNNCGKILGHGAFACVRLARRKRDGLHVAVKSIAKHEALRSRRLRSRGRTYLEEWEILRQLNDNPYVISLLDVYETDEEIQLVTEYCRGGELFDAIQKQKQATPQSLLSSPAALENSSVKTQYTEQQAACITKQILHALQDLESRGIVHRDIKAENILLVDNDEKSIQVKLCDFGMARSMVRYTSDSEKVTASCSDDDEDSGSDGDSSPLTPGRTQSFSLVGSDYYMAPEVRMGGTYSTAVDMYSLGVTVYIMLCGFPPVFSDDNDDDNEIVLFPDAYNWKNVSDEAKDLVRKLLLTNSEERISAKEALSHAWVCQCSLPFESLKIAAASTVESLDLVRERLYKALGTPKNQLSPQRPSSRKKRRVSSPTKDTASAWSCPVTAIEHKRQRRASQTLMVLADLYRVSSAPKPGEAATTATRPTPEAVSSASKDRRSSFTPPVTTALSI